MSAGFDPLYKWLGIPPDEQPPHCYRLLGLRAFEENPDAIESAADRQMAYLRTFQTGPNVQIAQELLNQVAMAKVWLLNPEKKVQYDAWLRQQLGSNPPSAPPVAAGPTQAQEAMPDLSDVLGDSDPYANSRGRLKKGRRRQWLGVAISLVAAVLAIGVFGLVALKFKESSFQEGTLEVQRPDGERSDGMLRGAKTEGAKAKPSGEQDDSAKKAGSAKEETDEFTFDKKEDKPAVPAKDESAEAKKSAPKETADAKTAAVPKASQQAQRLEVPDEAAQTKARQTVREVYKAQFDGAKTISDKQALAKKLLQEAMQTQSDPVGQFVLLQTTEEVAIESQDGLTAFSAVEELSQRYQVDALDLKNRILDTFAKKARLAEQHKSVADEALRLADEAMTEGRLPLAVQLGKMALREASKARDKETIQRTRTRAKELEEITAAYEEVKAATATLAEKPQDPQANLALGKYHCFFRGDWETGLPMLAQGSDANLKGLARREVEGASVAEAQAALADEWRALAAKSSGLVKRQQQARAALWYRKALPGLSGLAKAAAERWLKEFGAPQEPREPSPEM
jgi:hypothetical protein